jgi:hypothetical protein
MNSQDTERLAGVLEQCPALTRLDLRGDSHPHDTFPSRAIGRFLNQKLWVMYRLYGFGQCHIMLTSQFSQYFPDIKYHRIGYPIRVVHVNLKMLTVTEFQHFLHIFKNPISVFLGHGSVYLWSNIFQLRKNHVLLPIRDCPYLSSPLPDSSVATHFTFAFVIVFILLTSLYSQK